MFKFSNPEVIIWSLAILIPKAVLKDDLKTRKEQHTHSQTRISKKSLEQPQFHNHSIHLTTHASKQSMN